MKNYYPILGLHNFEKDTELIKSKYLEKAQYYHPEANNVPEDVAKAKLIEINEAYVFLGDSKNKSEYDKALYHLIYESNIENNKAKIEEHQPNNEQPNLTLYSCKKKKKSWIIVLLIIFLFAILLGDVIKEQHKVPSLSTPNISSSKSTSSIPPISTTPKVSNIVDPDSNLTPVQIENGEEIRKPKGERIAPFKVNTSSGENYYIVLENQNNPSDSVSFYITGGNSFKLNVPLGSYELYYATGKTWYGEEELFGSKTSYNKCEKTLYFNIVGNTINGNEVSLYKVINGNMPSAKISESQFPKV